MHAGQVSNKVPHNERYAGPPGWGLGMGLPSLPHKNCLKPWQWGGHGPKMEVPQKKTKHILK